MRNHRSLSRRLASLCQYRKLEVTSCHPVMLWQGMWAFICRLLGVLRTHILRFLTTCTLPCCGTLWWTTPPWFILFSYSTFDFAESEWRDLKASTHPPHPVAHLLNNVSHLVSKLQGPLPFHIGLFSICCHACFIYLFFLNFNVDSGHLTGAHPVTKYYPQTVSAVPVLESQHWKRNPRYSKILCWSFVAVTLSVSVLHVE